MLKGILHVTLDEKFIEAANLVFTTAFPEYQNDFYIITTRDGKLKHIKEKDNFHYILTDKSSLDSLYKKIPNYAIVVLHFLPDFSIKLINNAHSDTTFLWMEWGTEVYDGKIIKEKLYGKLSEKYVGKVNQLDLIKKEARRLAIDIVRFKELKTRSVDEKRKALKKIQLVGTFAQAEFDYFVSKGFLNPSAKFVRFSYYPLEFIFNNKDAISINSNNILIGNSSTPTNNHLETFEKLKNFDLGDRQLIVPLSYGSEDYSAIVQKRGKELFGNNFSPLLTFMRLEEYQEIVAGCNVVIMNHYRQQGVGNITAMLWLGAKIYLSERSILYRIFQDFGCHIFSIEKDLDPSNLTALNGLNPKEIEQNRIALNKQFSLKILTQRLRKDLAQYLKLASS